MRGGGKWGHGGGLVQAQAGRDSKGLGEPGPPTEGLRSEEAEEGHICHRGERGGLQAQGWGGGT